MRIYPLLTQDQEFLELGNLGFTGSLNDRQFSALRLEGLIGALPDMFGLFDGELSWTPDELLEGASQLAYYDPSDLDTLFQDSAGTTPVTAGGQSVGLVLDKSGNGNHLVQSTAGSRPLYGFHPATGVRNRLTYTEDFSNAAWAAFGAAVVANSGTDPIGTTTADKVYPTASSAAVDIRQTATIAGSTTYTATVYFSAAGINSAYLQINFTGGTTLASYVAVNLTNGTVSSVVALAGGGIGSPTGTVEDIGGGIYRLRLTGTSGVGNTSALVIVGPCDSTSSRSVTASGTNGVNVWGAQLELGASATAYQKVNTANGVTEAGVPTVHFLKFDGTDDFLVSAANLDPGAVDKVQVFAGVRKASDAARGTIAELSASIASANGGFHLTAPNAASDTFAFESKGTALTDAIATGFAAPATRVLTGLGDISGDSAVLRVNGVEADADSGDQGTGNYLSALFYLGRRGGSSQPFNGNIYSLIVRFSAANLDAAVIDQAEAWTAGKTGVTL